MENSWSIHQLISIMLGNLTLQASDGENVRLHWDKDKKTKTEAKELELEGSIDRNGVKMRLTVWERALMQRCALFDKYVMKYTWLTESELG